MAGVIAQECGSHTVYWVTVVSADSFWVSNSIYFRILSNFWSMFCRWHVLRASDGLVSDLGPFCRVRLAGARVLHSRLLWCGYPEASMRLTFANSAHTHAFGLGKLVSEQRASLRWGRRTLTLSLSPYMSVNFIGVVIVHTCCVVTR